MNKRYLHHLWTRVRPFKTWYFLLLTVVFGATCALALRDNNMTMVRLRDAVYQADRDNQDVEKALQNLRAYVNAHMNTNLSDENGVYPPIQLKYTYERLTKAEKDRVDTTNSRVYTEAQQFCEQQYPGSFSGGPRVPCIQQYVKEHGTQVRPIPADFYKFNFATPPWSLDLAGISLGLAVLFLILTVIRFVLGRFLQSYSR